MDRLSALIIAVVAAAGCDSKQAEQTPSRTDVVKSGAHVKATDVEAFCDVYTADDSGPELTLPELVGTVPPQPAGTWRWLNVWATWCEPCVAELPRLQRMKAKLAAGGRKVELAFVSIDEKEDDITAFRKAHPDTPETARLAKLDNQGTWFSALGVQPATPIPLHVFVSPGGHIRCARAGGVSDADYDKIDKLLSQ